MDALGLLIDGFGVALEPLNLGLALGGVVVGTTVGMLPGIGPINAIAMLLPLLFVANLAPASALILLSGIYYGSQYGNSISTILLNVPGTASAVVTALDGHAMTRAGRGGEALAVSAVSSFVGGTVSVLGLVFLAPAIISSWLRLLRREGLLGQWRENVRGLRALFGRGGFLTPVLNRVPAYLRPDFHPRRHDTAALEVEWRERLFGAQGALNAEFGNREALGAA